MIPRTSTHSQLRAVRLTLAETVAPLAGAAERLERLARARRADDAARDARRAVAPALRVGVRS